MPSAPKFWRDKNLTAGLLLPFSSLYLLGLTLHQNFRRSRTTKVGAPVISVGNITVGGAGKTPIVAALAENFTAHALQVGILMRGYGGKNAMPHLVTPHDNVAEVGDEALMLTQQFNGKPLQVWVAPNRAQAAKRAVKAGCKILIMDDGFQHRQLHRDVDIVVVDGKTGFGNSFVLPAGPLREPKSAMERADLVVIMGKRKFGFKQPTVNVTTALNTDDITAIKNDKIIAFCGIGYPEKFYQSLEEAKLNVIAKHSFGDHYTFKADELAALRHEATEKDATLLTTAKDFVRLPAAFQPYVNVVRLALDEDCAKKLMQKVSEKIG